MSIADNYNRLIARTLEHVDNKTTDMAETTMTVPSINYHCPERYKQEIDTIFRKVPLFIGLTQEIPNAGDFKTLQFLDKPLLITRDKNGQAHVMLNVCPHRAMLLSREERGNQNRFVCRYHGWMFMNDGELKSVNQAHTFGDFDKSCNGLKKLPVYERSGMIFTVLEPDTDEVDFEGFFAGMLDDLAILEFDKWNYCGQREIKGANWKVAYDGYLEGYHFGPAHPETIGARSFTNMMEFGAYGPHTLICFPHLAMKEKLDGVDPADYYKYENNGFDWIRTFFPNVSIFVAPEITMISQIIPGPSPSENTTKMYFIHRDQSLETNPELENIMDWLRDVVDVEDYQVGLAVQTGLEGGAYKDVTFGRNERGNQYFHKWVNWYMNGDASAAKPEL